MFCFCLFGGESLTEIREHRRKSRFRREDAECDLESEMHLICRWDSLALGNMKLRST